MPSVCLRHCLSVQSHVPLEYVQVLPHGEYSPSCPMYWLPADNPPDDHSSIPAVRTAFVLKRHFQMPSSKPSGWLRRLLAQLAANSQSSRPPALDKFLGFVSACPYLNGDAGETPSWVLRQYVRNLLRCRRCRTPAVFHPARSRTPMLRLPVWFPAYRFLMQDTFALTPAEFSLSFLS